MDALPSLLHSGTHTITSFNSCGSYRMISLSSSSLSSFDVVCMSSSRLVTGDAARVEDMSKEKGGMGEREADDEKEEQDEKTKQTQMCSDIHIRAMPRRASDT